jgi:hypothetical protein
MIDALIKRVSVTYKCYEMYAHRGKKVQLNNIYKLHKHVLLSHQSYLIVFMCNKNLRFWQIMPL